MILVTSRSFSSGDRDLVAELAERGHQVVRSSSAHDALDPHLADADAWIAGTGPITRDMIARAPRMRVIARYGVGVESVDLDACRARGIVVTNTPGANSDAVAEHALGLMLAALRGTADGDHRVRAGDWATRRGRQLGQQCVGIVGFGRIGQGVARRLAGFGPRILVQDPYLDRESAERLGAEPATLADIWEACDLVTLHAPGGDALVTASSLADAHGLTLVNTARAELVDEAALADALRDGRVAAYAADTLAGDTRADSSPLLADDLADRVTITPHLGAQTVEAIDAMGAGAVANALAVLDGSSAPNPVI